MSIIDLLGSINFFVGNAAFSSPASCTLQGILVEFSVANPLWNCCFVMNVMLRVVCNFHKDSTNKLESLYHLISWGVPIIGSIIGIANNAYNIVGAWCWFDADHVGLRFGTFYGFVFFSILFNIIVTCIVMWYIRQNTGNFKNPKLIKSGQRQLMYVAAFIVSFGPSSITRIVQFVTGKQYFLLTVFQAVTLPLQGFLNFLVYLKIKNLKTKHMSLLPRRSIPGNWFPPESYSMNLTSYEI